MTNKHTSFDALIQSVRETLKSEFGASEDLKAEFISADDYAAYVLAKSPKIQATWKAGFDELAALAAAEAVAPIR
jgi:hypothetical protein